MGFSASRLTLGLACAVALAGLSPTGPARAQIGSDRYAAIVTEARSGAVLVAASPDDRRYPASLTKMMTVYMALEALRDGRTDRSAPIRVSAHAAAMPPSRLGLTPGMTLTVEEAILALVTKSANDAAAALGEHLGGGSEHRFAQMMTLKARALGMTRTTFRNASGLPDEEQVSTARDMALLGRRLVQDFPREYAYFSTPHFVFRGRTHWNHNRLLQEYDGTDGIKTGYINDSGFNLVASAERDGVRLVAAVFGGRTGRERDRHMMAILDQGFLMRGVAPRDPVVASARTGLLSSARAATRPAAGRTATAAATGQARGRSTAPARTQTAQTRRGAPAAASTTRLVTTRGAPAASLRTARGTTARAAAPATRTTSPSRPSTLRLTATQRAPTAAATRIEQGDTGAARSRGTAARQPVRPATATPKKRR